MWQAKRRFRSSTVFVALVSGILLAPLVARTEEPSTPAEKSPATNKMLMSFAAQHGEQFALLSFEMNAVAGKVIFTHDKPILEPSWSPDGKQVAFVAFRDGPGQIYVYDLETQKTTRITNTKGYERNPTWSPDGMKIVFTSSRTGDQDIFSMNPDGTNVVNLSQDPGYDADPAWSPNGEKIAFASMRGVNPFLLFSMNADGSGQERLSERQLNGWLYPTWSPDGQAIAVGEYGQQGSVSLLIFDVKEKQFAKISKAEGCNSYASWSPDGRFIAYAHFEQVPPAFTLDTKIDPNAVGGDLMLYDRESKSTSTLAKGILPQWGPRPCWIPQKKQEQ